MKNKIQSLSDKIMKLKYSMKSMLRKQQSSQLNNSANSRVPKCAR